MGAFVAAKPPPWYLCHGRGEAVYEVDGKDIQKYNRPDFWLAVKWWKHCYRNGLPGDWRKLTVQQLAVKELFDDLQARREK